MGGFSMEDISSRVPDANSEEFFVEKNSWLMDENYDDDDDGNSKNCKYYKNNKCHLRSVFRRQLGQRKRYICRPASRNVAICFPLLLPPMGYWMWRQRLPWKGYSAAWQQSGSNSTREPADTSRLLFPWFRCWPHTGASRGTGFRHIRSACNDHSGRTALD